MNEEIIAGYGINYDRGVKNCMGDQAFYKKILGMFQMDTCYQRAKAAYEAQDYKTLFACMHDLKGTSGNAALTALYEATVPLVELLRAGKGGDPRVPAMFDDVSAAYGRAIEGIDYIAANT